MKKAIINYLANGKCAEYRAILTAELETIPMDRVLKAHRAVNAGMSSKSVLFILGGA